MKSRDPEIEAMAMCWEAIRRLGPMQRARVVNWLDEKRSEPPNETVHVRVKGLGLEEKEIVAIVNGKQSPLFPPGAVEGLQQRAAEVRDQVTPKATGCNCGDVDCNGCYPS